METRINGVIADWTDEIIELWDEVPVSIETEVVTANYFTARPWRSQYDQGSEWEGFTYTIRQGWERNVWQWCRHVGRPSQDDVVAERKLKLYRAQPDTTTATVESSQGVSYQLDPRHDLRNHSPDGFSWGYGGSGPAQFSLAILADYTGNDEVAQNMYQRFKFDRVARQPMEAPFVMPGREIEAWLSEQGVEL